MAPTMGPIPDYLKNPQPVDWSNPTKESILSNSMYYDDFKPSGKKEPGASECQAPQQLKSADIFATATDLATKMGADTQCIKSAQNNASTQSASKAFDERSAISADYHAKADAWIASASVSASASAQHSKTTAEQQSGSQNNQASYSAGCGSMMITANNVAQKQLAMQCVINNVSQNTDISAGASSTITIHTTPLTDAEVANVATLQAANNKIVQNNSNAIKDLYMILIQKAKPDGTPFYSADDIMKMIEPLKGFYDKQQDKLNSAIDIYKRDINISNSTIKNIVLTSVKTFSELTTSAKSDLATLSASIQKDLTAQSIANDMGVSAQDPNVKTMASKACESTSSSSSSSITNILNSLKVTANASGKIDIYAAGVINITNSVITNDITIQLATQAVMNQAVANSQSAAAQFMADSANTQGVVNKVAGLESLQKALGTTISDAISANQKAIIHSQDVGAAQIASYNDKVKAFATSSSGRILGAILVGLLLIWYFRGTGTASSGGGVNRFRSFRFNRF
jgi:hypothetical protein